MAIGLVKGNTLVAIKQESTEGTAIAPAAGTDFVQVLEDGLEISPAKELVERSVLTDSIGKITPRVSVKSATGAMPVEFRAGGVEGDKPQYELLLDALLGNSRQISSRITTGTTHTTTLINATAHGLAVGDFIVILESGAHHSAFITAVNANDFTFSPAMGSAPSDAVEIAKSSTFYPANTGQPTFTKSVYWGDEIRERMIGCRCSSMSLDNFTTGQISSLNFATESLSFDEADGTSPYTPSYDTGLPPLVLSACVYQDGVQTTVNEFSMSVENTIAFLTSTCSSDGRISSRIAERVLSGSFNPYKDDTSVANFTTFDDNTLFSLIITAQNPSATTGEFELGSCVGIYLPNCLMTEKTVADQDGVLIENISFSANRGEAGTSEEIYMGFC